MMFSSTHPGWKVFLFSLGLLASHSLAGEPAFGPLMPDASPVPGSAGVTCVDELRRLCPLELELLFTRSPLGSQPVGFARGEILHLANTHLPGCKAKMAGKVWKGKVFCESGEFVNQWKHFQAIRSRAKFGPSYLDGAPCMILEYDPRIPFFGNMRDEVRQVGPNIYLSMVFDRSGCHTFRGFIALELQCDGCCKK